MNNKAAILFAIAATSFAAGWKVHQWKTDSELLELQQNVARSKAELEKKQNEVEVANIENQRLIEQGVRVVTKEVVLYRNSDCSVQPDWVRIHNCAVRGTESTCEPDAATAETFTDGEALAAVTQNYGICLSELNRFAGLQSWIKQLRDQ